MYNLMGRKSMNILYVCAYRNNIIGGVRSVVPQYLENMSKCANVYVFSLAGVKFENALRKYSQIMSVAQVKKKLKDMDIVVFHEVYYMSYYYLARILLRNNIPYIVIPHCSLTHGAQEHKKVIKKIVNKVWVNKFIEQACRIQYSSVYEKESSKLFRTKSIIIPNGIYLLPGVSKDYKKHDSIEFIFIGRFSVKQKGLDLLLDACAIIRNEMKDKNININLYGSDFEGGKEYLQNKISEYGIENNVKIYSPIYGDEKQKILSKCDVYILTSRYEGLPMMILEAMRIGLPLLVTPGTGCLEVVQKEGCGWGVEENAVSISKGILDVANKKERLPVMSANAVRAVENYYSWDKVIVKTKKEYEKLLQVRHGGEINGK